ncbi:MAG: hypothetical protein EP330_15125 [Deltaproteobacteria bacterium]|nr:MAG: hypothetical protein EP330_15125 [Deltaproteobacteria bacterium]
MRRLETHDWWPELLALKDERSLRELAEQFGVTPGAITAALRRQGISRAAAPPGPRKSRKGGKKAEKESTTRGAGAKLEPHKELLGTVPDDVVAEKAGVSRRTVANYRAKLGIAGYRGPRRRKKRTSAIDEFAHLLGTQPDAAIAELAGVSGNAVRAYRVRRGIPSWRSGGREEEPEVATEAAPTAAVPASKPVRSVPTATGQQFAWKVRFADGREAVVVSDSLSGAAGRAEAAGEVRSLERVGEILGA